jgi:murein DD-endopeptidase MepM/ murein hydrolase activator NlpD
MTYAQSLYKYRDDNGHWVYTDRLPDTSNAVEVRSLSTAPGRATVSVTHELKGGEIVLTAHNDFYAPVEVIIILKSATGVASPQADDNFRWVVAARSEQRLFGLPVLTGKAEATIDYGYVYLPGDPTSRHRFDKGYRVPFVAGGAYPVTQAYPDKKTHVTPDSLFAVDIAMPIGTDVLAARGGIVFDVVSKNFRGSTEIGKHVLKANVVRILHDDGTFAVYAHLNWDSIRVRPGERVVAGQYIADSGNTGFSSGPHLHFAVQRNAGMRIEALPISFRGLNTTGVVPATGSVLTAYP